MVRAIKKPIHVSAYQWFPEWDLAMSPDTGYIDYSELVDGYQFAIKQAVIYTLEGILRGSAGDWIIIEENDQRSFCSDAIFKKNFEFTREETNVGTDIPDQ